MSAPARSGNATRGSALFGEDPARTYVTSSLYQRLVPDPIGCLEPALLVDPLTALAFIAHPLDHGGGDEQRRHATAMATAASPGPSTA